MLLPGYNGTVKGQLKAGQLRTGQLKAAQRKTGRLKAGQLRVASLKFVAGWATGKRRFFVIAPELKSVRGPVLSE